jgi:3-phenylpropionate/trans-cinnamate dioxygenase ferredoxin reductase subunit
MRTLADADALKADFRSGRRLLVLGGGYIGLETAAVAAKAGLDVCVIEQAPRILQRVACEQTASLIRDLHRQHGVRILEGRCVIRFIGTDRFTALALDDGTQLEADLIVVGIGVLPCTGLAQDAGLKCDNGIRVDLYGRSSAPDIWAAGDCANFPYQGIPTRLESVPNAVEQAECAADDMLSLSRPYQPIPWFWSDQYDMKLQIVGLNRGYDRVLPVPSERGHSLWYFRDGRMIAVDALNDARAFMAAKRLFEKDITLTLEEALGAAGAQKRLGSGLVDGRIAVDEQLDNAVGQILRRDLTIGAIPCIGPIDHAEKQHRIDMRKIAVLHQIGAHLQQDIADIGQ